MKPATLIRRSISYYWRTNLAVVLGVAIAVAVLSGALLVGQSVRTSLRNIALARLGHTGTVVTAANFFRAGLAEAYEDSCPLISITGVARHQASGRLAASVLIYGVDERFWHFHGQTREAPSGRQVYLNEPLARELQAAPGDGILIRLEEVSAIPAESIHGRKEESGKTIRLSAAGVLSEAEMGEFSLQASQGTVRAVFLPLERLQHELLQPGKINTLLLGPGEGGVEEKLRQNFGLEDLGLRVRALPNRSVIQVESRSGLLSDDVAAAAEEQMRSLGLAPSGLLTYLANTIRVGEKEVPYSLVSAVGTVRGDGSPPPIELNQWAARDLGARLGDIATLDFYLWRSDNTLGAGSAEFRVSRIVPVARDPEMVPEYPGITDTEDVTDWNPPFPVDLSRVRPRDEAYWDDYRTTPKAFIGLETGQRLWKSPYGKLTSIRAEVPEDGDPVEVAAGLREKLRAALDPVAEGFYVIPVREQSLASSRGATDFGEYFVYFSFFLVVSALLLAGLFFRLGVEQRVRETGLLEAVGIPAAGVRKIFGGEGVWLAVAGAAIGTLGAVLYCETILYGLRTWWFDAVGTEAIRLDSDPAWLAAGALGGVVVSVLALLWTLRGLRRVSPRDRLAGVTLSPRRHQTVVRRARLTGAVAAILGFALLGVGAAGLIPDVAGFFGSGTLLLIAALFLLRSRLGDRRASYLSGAGPGAVARLGFRNASHRPGRTVLSVTLIASAIFLIVSVDAFRLGENVPVSDPAGPAGGYPLMAESSLPLYQNPETAEGREALGIDGLDGVTLVPFRLRPGDDVSCLNLYRPQNPRILGVPAEFIESGRFSFQSSVAESGDRKANPWKLLLDEDADGAIPAAVAANSMQYILHRKLGDVVQIPVAGDRSVPIRLVAALADSVFQRELLISQANFRRHFPDHEGYRVFLIGAPPESLEETTTELEDILSDFGFDVVSTGEALAGFHRIENTYLSTFQSLGALGLVLGTLGLSVILLRNVLERRRELALLRAVGYRSWHIALMILAENLFLLTAGILIGTVTALLSIAPALSARGGSAAPGSLVLLVAAVFATGLLSSLAATAAALRFPLLSALRSE